MEIDTGFLNIDFKKFYVELTEICDEIGVESEKIYSKSTRYRWKNTLNISFPKSKDQVLSLLKTHQKANSETKVKDLLPHYSGEMKKYLIYNWSTELDLNAKKIGGIVQDKFTSYIINLAACENGIPYKVLIENICILKARESDINFFSLNNTVLDCYSLFAEEKINYLIDWNIIEQLGDRIHFKIKANFIDSEEFCTKSFEYQALTYDSSYELSGENSRYQYTESIPKSLQIELANKTKNHVYEQIELMNKYKGKGEDCSPYTVSASASKITNPQTEKPSSKEPIQ